MLKEDLEKELGRNIFENEYEFFCRLMDAAFESNLFCLQDDVVDWYKRIRINLDGDMMYMFTALISVIEESKELYQDLQKKNLKIKILNGITLDKEDLALVARFL